ncbi:MAG: lipid A deacylase LpxR family protein [Verrucomicrobiia bacterium]
MKCSVLIFAGLIATFLLSAGTASYAAVDQPQDAIFAFTEENDTFGNPPGPHQDRHYTQGLEFTYRAGDNDFRNATATLSAAIPTFAIDPSAADLGFVFGQNMYTPTDLRLKNPDPHDRPYAGWLYGGVFLQRRGVTTGSIPVLENFEANVGIIGPGSLAGTIQTSFHTSIGATVPQGWGHQLKTEPGLDLKYARLWRLSMSPESARYCDLIPYVGGSVGNILIAGNIGTTVRIGWDLPNDFGVPLIDSPYNVNGGLTADAPAFSAYGFGRVEGRAIGHNIFLDGSSFRDGPHVDKEPLVGDLSLGAAMRLFRHLELSYMHVVRTSEFVHQANKDQFGSFTVKALFSF